MHTTPTIDAARAAIVAAIDTADRWACRARWIGSADSSPQLTCALEDTAEYFRRHHSLVPTGPVTQDFVDKTRMCDRVSVACRWLACAMRVLNWHNSQTDADKLAMCALEELLTLQPMEVCVG